MYVDFIVNDCSTVQTYFKRFAHTWPGVYYAQVLNDFPLLWVVKMFCLKKKKLHYYWENPNNEYLSKTKKRKEILASNS